MAPYPNLEDIMEERTYTLEELKLGFTEYISSLRNRDRLPIRDDFEFEEFMSRVERRKSKNA